MEEGGRGRHGVLLKLDLLSLLSWRGRGGGGGGGGISSCKLQNMYYIDSKPVHQVYYEM